jgi:hypothetical protein
MSEDDVSRTTVLLTLSHHSHDQAMVPVDVSVRVEPVVNQYGLQGDELFRRKAAG